MFNTPGSRAGRSRDRQQTTLNLRSGQIVSLVGSSPSAFKISTKNNLGVMTPRLQIAAGSTNATTQINFLNCGIVNFNSAACGGLLSLMSNSAGFGNIGSSDNPWGNVYTANLRGGDNVNYTDFLITVDDGGGNAVPFISIPLTGAPLTATWAAHLVFGDARDISVGTTTGTKIGTATTQKIGFYNATPVVRQTDGAALTNSVTVGGTTNTIADITSLTVYATDAATIRNNIYQLARKVKIIGDALRAYGLLS